MLSVVVVREARGLILAVTCAGRPPRRCWRSCELPGGPFRSERLSRQCLLAHRSMKTLYRALYRCISSGGRVAVRSARTRPAVLLLFTYRRGPRLLILLGLCGITRMQAAAGSRSRWSRPGARGAPTDLQSVQLQWTKRPRAVDDYLNM